MMASKGKHEAGGKERDPVPNSFTLYLKFYMPPAHRKAAHSELDSPREHGAGRKHEHGTSARLEEPKPRSWPELLLVSLGVPEPAPEPPSPATPWVLVTTQLSPPRASPFSFDELTERFWQRLRQSRGCLGSHCSSDAVCIPLPSSFDNEKQFPPAVRSERRQQ